MSGLRGPDVFNKVRPARIRRLPTADRLAGDMLGLPNFTKKKEYMSIQCETHSHLLSARTVRERYGVTGRTLDRWLTRPSLAFPRPIRINGRKYWYEADLMAWERSRHALSAPTDLHPTDRDPVPGIHSPK
jgi:predicted DNA-binding transcriptional regulator AlpA